MAPLAQALWTAGMGYFTYASPVLGNPLFSQLLST